MFSQFSWGIVKASSFVFKLLNSPVQKKKKKNNLVNKNNLSVCSLMLCTLERKNVWDKIQDLKITTM